MTKPNGANPAPASEHVSIDYLNIIDEEQARLRAEIVGCIDVAMEHLADVQGHEPPDVQAASRAAAHVARALNGLATMTVLTDLKVEAHRFHEAGGTEADLRGSMLERLVHQASTLAGAQPACMVNAWHCLITEAYAQAAQVLADDDDAGIATTLAVILGGDGFEQIAPGVFVRRPDSPHGPGRVEAELPNERVVPRGAGIKAQEGPRAGA